MHWSSKYIGEKYVESENDCAALAARVQKEVFNREISLPTERFKGLRDTSRQIQLNKYDYAEPTYQPAEGDVVLMIGRGRINHIGVYFLYDGVPHVLHAMRDAGQVCSHKLRDLEKNQLSIEGFYKWIV